MHLTVVPFFPLQLGCAVLLDLVEVDPTPSKLRCSRVVVQLLSGLAALYRR